MVGLNSSLVSMPCIFMAYSLRDYRCPCSVCFTSSKYSWDISGRPFEFRQFLHYLSLLTWNGLNSGDASVNTLDASDLYTTKFCMASIPQHIRDPGCSTVAVYVCAMLDDPYLLELPLQQHLTFRVCSCLTKYVHSKGSIWLHPLGGYDILYIYCSPNWSSWMYSKACHLFHKVCCIRYLRVILVDILMYP